MTLSDNVRGVMWALVATGLFAMVAAMAKVAVTDYHILQILFFRQLMVFLSSLPAVAGDFPQSLKTQYPMFHAARLFGAFVALSCGIWAVAVLPLTTAVTLSFTQVFFVSLLAFCVLREAVGPQRLLAVAAGFLGVLVVMRPGVSGLLDFHTLIPVAGAVGAAIAQTSVRKLSQTESTATLLVYQSVFVGLLSAVPLFWVWVTPSAADTLFLLLMGALSTAANWIGVRALRLGEASVIAGVQYTQLVYAALLGLLIFDEIPDAFTICGAAIIIASALYVIHREK